MVVVVVVVMVVVVVVVVTVSVRYRWYILYTYIGIFYIRIFIYLLISGRWLLLLLLKFAATHLQKIGVGIVLWTILMDWPLMILSRYFRTFGLSVFHFLK